MYDSKCVYPSLIIWIVTLAKSVTVHFLLSKNHELLCYRENTQCFFHRLTDRWIFKRQYSTSNL